MFAVVKISGKQYQLESGDIIAVDKLQGEAGTKLVFDEILLLGEKGKAPELGTPHIANAKIEAEIIEQRRAKKITIFKMKRRQNYRRTAGHRKDETVLKITKIGDTKKAPAKKAPAKKEEKHGT
ncbi:MAG: 50S ribosomal protein L21 [Parvibaculales bacterium]